MNALLRGLFTVISLKDRCPFYIRWITWFPHHILRGPSIPIQRTVALSWPSLALTSASLPVILDSRRVIAYRQDTRLKYSDCTSALSLVHSIYLIFVCRGRTDKAVLAVNGFAADGSMFVKRVRQRLEVCVYNPMDILQLI